MPAEPCRTTREWLSAHRDREALDDPGARAHLRACEACRAWEGTVGTVTRRLVVRPADTPDVTAAAFAEWRRREVEVDPDGRQRRIGRGVLAVAGVMGLALAGASLLLAPGAGGPAGTHLGRDLVALEGALSLGFLLACWRPEPYRRGLLPVVVAAGLLTLPASVPTAAGATASLLREAGHLPLLLGLTGLLLLGDAGRLGQGRPA